MKNYSLLFLLLGLFFSCQLSGQDCAFVKVQTTSAGLFGEKSCVKVAIANAGDIQSFQFRLRWNDDLMEYIDHTPIYPSNLLVGDAQADDGFFVASWFDGLNPINVSESKEVLNICFEIVDSSFLEHRISLSQVEFTDPMDNIIDVCERDGYISLEGNYNNEIELEILKTDRNCFVEDEGSIRVYPFFGQAPYTFHWSGSTSVAGNTSDSAEMLVAGAYTVTVDDTSGNNSSETVEIIDDVSTYVGVSSSSPDCQVGNDGRITLNLIETFPPYQIAWSNGETGSTIDNLEKGKYSYTITDANACAITGELFLFVSFNASIDFDAASSFCPNENTGSIRPVVSNVVSPPLTYQWSNGSTDMDQFNLAPGTYFVTITDADGCFDTWDIPVGDSPFTNISVNESGECATPGESNGSANLSLSIPVSDGEVIWNDGQRDSIFWFSIRDNLAAGTYSYSIVTQSTCIIAQGEVTIDPGLENFQTDYIACGSDSIPMNAGDSSGQLSYQWVPSNLFTNMVGDSTQFIVDATVDSIPDFLFGALNVTGLNGCTESYNISVEVNEHCVWPGDANDDNIADLSDLLFVGLANGSTGLARDMVSIEWSAQESQLWNVNIGTTAIDMMHADCNGDGAINALDSMAISQNLNLTHSFDSSKEIKNKLMDIPLFLSGDANLLSDEQHSLDISLGADLNPAIDVHGLAFTVSYDDDILNILTYLNNGWLNNDNEAWKMERLGQNAIRIAISRNDGIGISNEGKIGELSFFIEKVDANQILQFAIEDILLLDVNGMQIPSANDPTDIQVLSETSSVNELSSEELIVFPNPFKDRINLETEYTILETKVYSLDGSVALIDNIAKKMVDLSALPKGCYLLKVVTEEGIATRLINKL